MTTRNQKHNGHKRSDLEDNCGHSGLAEAYAKERGLICVYPEPNELFIDIDQEFELDHFEWAFSMFQQLYPGAEEVTKPSKSGEAGHFHITVILPFEIKSPEQRVMLQAILGSDPKRELLTLKNIAEGDKTPTLFFEVPEEN
jgi:hypothetical protein